ncbi:hypothetical protein Tco_0168771 [Tanacetum coccineum]
MEYDCHHNEENELILTRLVSGWRVCIDYMNNLMKPPEEPLPFTIQGSNARETSRNEYYMFLDGFSGYFKIPIDPKESKKYNLTCPYETFAYRRMPFGLAMLLEISKVSDLGLIELKSKYRSIVYTDHVPSSILCQEDAWKEDACGGNLLLQDLTLKFGDKKSEHLAPSISVRLENQHQTIENKNQ